MGGQMANKAERPSGEEADAVCTSAMLRALSQVSTQWRAAVQPWLATAATEALKQFLPPEALQKGQELLNLSSAKMGDVECTLIAHAITRGKLGQVRTLWLQNNYIGLAGLEALADCLAADK